MGLPQQDPSLQPKPAKADKAPILSSVPPPVQEEPKKEQPKSVTGFMENALDDAWDLAKGLYEIFPSTIKSYQQNLPYILKNLDALTPGMLVRWNSQGGDKDQIIKGQFEGAIPETAKAMLEAVKEPYVKHGASVLYHRPITAVSDAIGAATLVGGSVKSVGMMSKAAGGGAKAERLIQIGKALEELPGKIARQSIDATVKTATGGAWDLAKRRKFLELKGDEMGRKVQRIERDVETVVKKIDALTPEEKELFHKARVLGDAPGVGVPDELLSPNVKAALDAYSDLVNKVDPNMVDHGITEFYKSRGFLNAETAETTLAKKFALEAFDDVSPASIAKAKELIAQSKRKPVYGQNVFVDDVGKTFSADTVLDDMITGGKKMREGKVDPLEAMKGAKGYTKDPSIYVREMIKNFRNTEAKARLSERLLESKQLIKGGASGMEAKDIPEGIHRKYYEDRIRAEALKNIQDPTIKRLLKWEYMKNNSSLVKLYDRIHGLFAKSATMFNPKWVTGNLIGDAVLGLIAGSDWVEGMRALKRGSMPAQVAAKNVTLSTQDILAPRGKLSAAVHYLPEKAADVAGWVDQATRAGIITKEVGRRLKEAALSFEGVAATFEDVLRSTDRFSDVQVQMRLLEERAARGSLEVRRRDSLIARLQQREKALAEKLEAIELKAQIGPYQKVQEHRQAAEALKQKAVRTAEESAAEANRVSGGYGPDVKAQPEKLKEWQKAKKLSGKADAVQREAVLGAVGKKTFDKGVEKLQDIRQKIVNLTAERDAIVRDITDDLAKSGELERLVPGLKQQVDILRPAVERANAFVGDYLALDGFEQGVLRRAIPFYPWAKAMTMLAFRLPFIAPIKTFAWNRFSDALLTMVDDPELGKEFRGRIPVTATKDGKIGWAKITAYDPFSSLKTSNVGGIPVPQMFNIRERNFFADIIFSAFGAKSIYDVGSTPYGEPQVSLGDGTVLKVKPNGLIERDISPTPLVSSILHKFPTTQLIQSVLQPYWTNKYDWAGMPEPILNADGSYRYPREMLDRLGALVGVNVMTRSREDIVRQKKIKAIKNVREMQVQYKRTQDPEEREFIMNAMRNYIQQEIHGGKP